jgi:hypothetical protein
MKYESQKRDLIKSAEELCDCPDCVQARAANKMLSACERAKISRKTAEWVVPPNASNFLPELSPNYFDNKSPRISR